MAQESIRFTPNLYLICLCVCICMCLYVGLLFVALGVCVCICSVCIFESNVRLRVDLVKCSFGKSFYKTTYLEVIHKNSILLIPINNAFVQ